MHLKNKFLTGAALIGAIAFGSTAAMAQETKTDTKTDKTVKEAREGRHGMRKMHGRFGKGGFGRMRGMGFQALNLTDAQKEQIRAIREANKPDMTLHNEVRSIRESRKAGTDLTAEQKARLHAIQDQMRVKAQTVHDQVQNVLTAEQKAQLATQRAEMKQRMEQFRLKREEFRKQRELKKKPAAETTKKIV